jgi:GAF domain-containing protein
MGIPLIHRGAVTGMIALDSEHRDHFTPEMAALGLTFASQCATSIANAQLFEEKEQRLEELNTLYRASHEITSELDLKTVLHEIVERVHRLAGSDLTGVVLVDQDGRPTMSVENQEIEPSLHERIRLDGATHQVVTLAKPLIRNDILKETELHNEIIVKMGIRSYAAFPIRIGDRVRGVLFLHSYHTSTFEGMEPRLLPFCKQASVAIKNADLYFQVVNQVDKFKKLVEFSEELLKYKAETDLLEFCVCEGMHLFRTEDCSISLKNEERKTIDLVASSSIPSEVWSKRDAYTDGPGLTAHVLNTGELLNLSGDEYKGHPAWAGKYEDPFLEHLSYLPSRKCNSLLIGPLKDGQGNHVGVMKLENHQNLPKERRFSEFEEQLFNNFTTMIGIAIERTRLVDRLDKEARREARLSLGDDLHDTMNMIHSAIGLRSDYCKRLLNAQEYEKVNDELQVIHKAARNIFSSLRWTVNDLKSGEISPNKPLTQRLKDLEKMLLIPISITVSGRGPLPIEIEERLYKIGAEALYNIVKHALIDNQPPKVEVVLEMYPDRYRMDVKDYGKGFNEAEVKAREDTFGLNIIASWAKNMGAQHEITSKPGEGTMVSVWNTIERGEHG